MACFIVPATEAVVTTIATKIIANKETQNLNDKLEGGVTVAELNKENFSGKLKRLNYMLWGGSALLAFEHVWHGEVQPFFPFLTAAGNPADAMEMLHEMSTVGVSMAVLVTAVWGVMTLVTNSIEKKESDFAVNKSTEV
ncbi:MAG: hypothetical protein KBS96_09260 [Lachnospiraceae bacterium]|nr:hypothetical protein [Candidatus Colinaster scatohippi]